MDFWEGVFLGPVWAHTDYQDRRHPAFHFTIGFLALVFLLAYQLLPQLNFLLPLPLMLYLGISLTLLFTLPFLAASYYARPFLIRVFILLAYALQYISAWAFFAKLSTHRIDINLSDLFLHLGDIANGLMTRLADFFSFLGGITATLAGVVVGALLLGILSIIAFIISVYLPLLYLFVLKQIQRFIDAFIFRHFYANRAGT